MCVCVCVCVLYLSETWVNLFFPQCTFYMYFVFCFKNYIFGGGAGEVGDGCSVFCNPFLLIFSFFSYRIQIFLMYVFYFSVGF